MTDNSNPTYALRGDLDRVVLMTLNPNPRNDTARPTNSPSADRYLCDDLLRYLETRPVLGPDSDLQGRSELIVILSFQAHR